MTHYPGIPAERYPNVATSPPDDNWTRVGDALAARRPQLDPSFENRATFAKATGVDYRVLFDIETHKRTNFGTKTITRIEQAYGLPDGAIEAALDDPGFVDFSRLPIPRQRQGAPSAAVRKRLNVVPDWVGSEEQRWRMRLHQDAVSRGLDKTGHLVDGLNVERRENELWDLLSDTDSPEVRYNLIVTWRDLDDAVARGGTAGDGEVERGNGTER